MRIGLLIIAVLALVAFIVVAVVLPQRNESGAKEAAQALVAGAEPAKKQVEAAAAKSNDLAAAGKGVKIGSRTMPSTASSSGSFPRTAPSAAGTKRTRSRSP